MIRLIFGSAPRKTSAAASPVFSPPVNTNMRPPEFNTASRSLAFRRIHVSVEKITHPRSDAPGTHSVSGAPSGKWSAWISTQSPASRKRLATLYLPTLSSRKNTIGSGSFAERFPSDRFVDLLFRPPIVLGELVR